MLEVYKRSLCATQGYSDIMNSSSTVIISHRNRIHSVSLRGTVGGRKMIKHDLKSDDVVLDQYRQIGRKDEYLCSCLAAVN